MKEPEKPDWLSDEEWLAHKRHVWNDLQASIDNPSPVVKAVSAGIIIVLVVCLGVWAVIELLNLIVDALKSLFS